MTALPLQDRLNALWRSLLDAYPNGVSNTSTTKYNEIHHLLSSILGVTEDQIYPTGAKTRTTNFGTRFVQNSKQAGRHTKVGIGFIQGEDPEVPVEIEKTSDSAVVTCRKFVDGSDNTRYDAILIFLEVSPRRLQLTRVIQSSGNEYFNILKPHFPEAKLVTVEMANSAEASSAQSVVDPQSGYSAALTSVNSLIGLVKKFNEDAKLAELQVSPEVAHRLLACLLSKRFLIATGLAGSGKTKLAQAIAHWLSMTAKCHVIVPVGADWTGNENVLGYPNGLDKETYISKPALDLIIHAKEHSGVPHFLILDEMNLSHVERYFADILSVIESEDEIQLYDGLKRQANGVDIPASIRLPYNLFIIGTVNVDETTYMFSPKVLDRANVIEFRMEIGELDTFLIKSSKPDLSKLDGQGHKAGFSKPFVDAAMGPADLSGEQMKSVKLIYDPEIRLFFKVLQGHWAEFGYRTAYEAARFVHFYKLLGNHQDGAVLWFTKAFDCVVFQKFLPKLHGSRAKLGPLLKVLWFLCVNDATGRTDDPLKAAEEAARSTDKKAEPSAEVPAGAPYPMSAEKIGRMWRLLRDNGFASFTEA